MCTDIRQVDASGTTVSIIMPTEPKVTKYEVGTPTSINLENPTVLTPAGILVDNYANLDSLVIKNVPSTKSYTMFDRVMSNYGGMLYYGKTLNNALQVVDGMNGEFVTSRIYLPQSRKISITTTNVLYNAL
jgi:hypothetical protein